jgi:hypothetical protein
MYNGLSCDSVYAIFPLLQVFLALKSTNILEME